KVKVKLKNYFPVIFITLVVLISVSLLVGIDSITAEKIEQQEEQKVRQMLGEMFIDMDRSEFHDENEIYTIYSDDDVIGFAFLALGRGYGGDINILVGLEDETTLKGITIISQTETPGLGTRITDSDFTDMFTGTKIDDIGLKRDNGGIDALTGATISSRAVVDAVKAEALEKVTQLKGGE
ncbi:RnfABCDGE type electron transport complex subunit G, partial [Chloroflexota bacterium]